MNFLHLVMSNNARKIIFLKKKNHYLLCSIARNEFHIIRHAVNRRTDFIGEINKSPGSTNEEKSWLPHLSSIHKEADGGQRTLL